MTDERKTKQQLVAELQGMRLQVADLSGRLQLLEEKDATKRMHAAEALQESEARFMRFAENAQDLIYRYRLAPTPGFEYVSPAATAITGYTPEEHYADPQLGFKLVHPDDRPLLEALARSSPSFGEPLVLRWRRKDGTTIWTEQRNVPIYDQAGNLVALEGIARDITARKRAEEALRESEEQHRTLFETMAQGVVYQDAGGHITAANPAAERILGLTLDQMQGRTSMDPRWRAIHEDGSDFLGDTHPAMVALATGNPVQDVVMGVFNPETETYTWINVNAVPQFEPGQDRPCQVYATFDDITERKRAEEALRESEERLSSFMDSASDSFYLLDSDLNFVEINSRGLDISGKSREEVIGKNIADIVPDVKTSGRYEKHLEVLRTGQPFVIDRFVPHPVFGDLHFTLKSFRVGDGLGVIASDITERVRAKDALHQSNEFLQSVLQNSPSSIFVRDLDGRYLFANRQYQHVIGLTSEQMVGKRPEELHRPRAAAHIARNDELVLSSGAPFQSEEVVLVDDDPHTFIATKVALRDAAGQPYAFCTVATDITERVRAEEAILQASRLEATATLAGGIAHDFNNLMVGVLGYAEMLKMDLAGQENELDMLQAISESARRASKLAQQMLAFARGGKYQPRVVNLNDVAEGVLHTQRRSLPSRIHVECDTAPELWNVEADPPQMSEVVLNLLTNAVEAVEGDGRITITTSNRTLDEGNIADLGPGQYVCLAVRDTGHGMSEEVQARIFEPFFTTKFQGRGMGLAAVYGIVENHGGHIAVHSKEGQGATFEVCLPAIQAKAAPTESQGVTDAGAATILIVQDDESLLKLTQRVVERLGYRSLVAHSRQKALEIARSSEGEIRLALIDIEVPEMDRLEVYSLLTAARPKIKVILYGSHELDVRVQALLDVGISAFVQKPFQMSVLEAEIRGALED